MDDTATHDRVEDCGEDATGAATCPDGGIPLDLFWSRLDPPDE